MSTFVLHHTEKLFQAALSSPKTSTPTSITPSYFPSPQIQQLQAVLLAVRPSCSPRIIYDILSLLQRENDITGEPHLDQEKAYLRRTAIKAVLAWIYGQTLELCLRQATGADSEASWWSEVEGSRYKLSWYFLETLPLRMKRALNTILSTLRARHRSITPLSFTPNSLRRLFPTVSRPSHLAMSFFPHLSRSSHMVFRSPFDLISQECQHHRVSLEDIRDDCARRIGWLVSSRGLFETALASESIDLGPSITMMQEAINGTDIAEPPGDEKALVESLYDIVSRELPLASTSHNVKISIFLRPPLLMRIWPRLVIAPPITILLFRVVYGARWSVRDNFIRIVETVSGFWKGYLVQPCREILDTVRTGGENGPRIVSQEGLRSDMESLERMVLSLTREKYNLSLPEISDLSMQIQKGDLSSVLKIYEEDMKSPVRSVIAGTLVRSLLIQIQKMKVDVDVALSGIDKLLRSQELTFAFVGVAPALAIIYGVFGWVRSFWSTGRGKGKYGGKRNRREVWLSMRRIERLLTLSAKSGLSDSSQQESLSLLDLGLILLSVAHLRTYAETCFPARSRLQEEFLADVSDLEDPKLGRRERRGIVNRMWRSWGNILGWSSLGEI